jgi:hypothetical protein
MKKLLLLVGTFFAVNFLSAMEQRHAVFTVKDFGVDSWNYYTHERNFSKRIGELLDPQSSIDEMDVYLSADQKIKDLNSFIQEVEKISEGSEYDLNTDKFATRFKFIIDRAQDAVTVLENAQHEEKERRDLEVRVQKIDAYWAAVRDLRERFYAKADCGVVQLVAGDVKQKIAEFQAMKEEAQAISYNSQRELHEVGFAHLLSKLIYTSNYMINLLQADLSPEKNSRREKRDLEQESDSLKRLRLE